VVGIVLEADNLLLFFLPPSPLTWMLFDACGSRTPLFERSWYFSPFEMIA